MADVTIWSVDPDIAVTGTLIGTPTAPVPRPRFDEQARPGKRSENLYLGHEALEQTFQIKFDNPGNNSVQGKVDKLETLAERHHWAGRFEPPIVHVQGRGLRGTGDRSARRPGKKWRIAELTEDLARTRFQRDGDRYFYVATVRLVEHSVDEVLTERLKALRPADKRDIGITRRTTTVREGETSVYDVARRVYHDPSRAAQIARANPGTIRWLGQRLKPGTKLRLPA